MIFYAPLQGTQASSPVVIDPQRGILTAQIICVALIASAIAFLVMTLMIPGQAQQPAVVIAWIGLGVGTLQTLLRFVMPTVTARAQIERLVATGEKIDGHLFSIFQTRMIIGLALLEGACFLNLIAYLVERQWWSLAIVGVLLFLMMTMFPTLGHFESWADGVKRDLQNQF